MVLPSVLMIYLVTISVLSIRLEMRASLRTRILKLVSHEKRGLQDNGRSGFLRVPDEEALDVCFGALACRVSGFEVPGARGHMQSGTSNTGKLESVKHRSLNA